MLKVLPKVGILILKTCHLRIRVFSQLETYTITWMLGEILVDKNHQGLDSFGEKGQKTERVM
jgi:hypothetical protein